MISGTQGGSILAWQWSATESMVFSLPPLTTRVLSVTPISRSVTVGVGQRRNSAGDGIGHLFLVLDRGRLGADLAYQGTYPLDREL